MSAADRPVPAFPVPLYGDQEYVNHCPADGMTLRDYFAAKALAALIGVAKDDKNRGAKAVPQLARWSYEYADAMLLERAK